MLLLPTDSTGTDGEQGGVQKSSNQKVAGSFEPTSTAGAFAPNWSMSAIADDKIDTLHTLTIANERNWFGGRDGSVDSLVTLVARQSELKLLALYDNGFTQKQKERVRSAVANSECLVCFD